MKTQIRQLDKADAAAYRRLRLESFRESPFAFSESYEDESKKTEADFANDLTSSGEPAERFVLGAFSEDLQLIGFVTFKRDLRAKARHKSMIYAMYTTAGARRQGVGRALVTEVISRARRLEGLEQIHLWVLHGTTSAADFYRKLGFQSQGPVVKKDLKINGQYVDAGYMVLYLNE
jgi:GNAT superfamily N-acetyltransferase